MDEDHVRSIKGGNRFLTNKIIESSENINIKLNSKVTTIQLMTTLNQHVTGKYMLKYGDSKSYYDIVIIASPLEHASLSFKNIPLPESIKRKQKWWSTYTAIIRGKLSNKYFGVEEGEVPGVILTTVNDTLRFNSIGVLKEYDDGRHLYKIFSRWKLDYVTLD